MAHYAFIDENNIVVEVITGRNEDEAVEGISNWEEHYQEFRSGVRCKRTSYSASFRKNFAGIGFTYDESRDAFIPPKPYPSWVLNEDTCNWEPPTPKLSSDGMYKWVEDDLNWQLITP
jgi:hypothetical protein